jgi:hypothetical protein
MSLGFLAPFVNRFELDGAIQSFYGPADTEAARGTILRRPVSAALLRTQRRHEFLESFRVSPLR